MLDEDHARPDMIKEVVADWIVDPKRGSEAAHVMLNENKDIVDRFENALNVREGLAWVYAVCSVAMIYIALGDLENSKIWAEKAAVVFLINFGDRDIWHVWAKDPTRAGLWGTKAARKA